MKNILKANLSWTRKKSNSSEAKNFFVCIIISFCTKASWLQILKFEFCQIKVGKNNG